MYFGSLTYHYQKTGERFFLKMTLRHFWFGHAVEKIAITIILAIVKVSSSIIQGSIEQLSFSHYVPVHKCVTRPKNSLCAVTLT